MTDILLSMILAWCAVWISAKVALGTFFHPQIMLTRIILGSVVKWLCVGALGTLCLKMEWVNSPLLWGVSYIGWILFFGFAYQSILSAFNRYSVLKKWRV